MKKILIIIKYLGFIIIPFLCVLICRLFEIAQGETNEEVVFGIMIGLILDLLYAIILFLVSKKKNK